MPSTFFGLNIGKTGLYTYQSALNTTSHNIANAETIGYTRQVVNQKAGVAIKVNNRYGMAGSGVDVNSIIHTRNQYYDEKFRSNNTLYGAYKAKEHYMTEIQNYFNEIELEGFTTSFNKMYESLQDLSTDPSDLASRTQVTNFAKGLTEYFNYISTSMRSIQEECNFEISNQVDRINSLAQQIASLTKQINVVEVGGITANDLRDERELIIDELSQIVNVSVKENVVGDNVGVTSYIVKIDGQTLVDTFNYNKLLVKPRDNNKNEVVNQNDIEGLYDIMWATGQEFNVYTPTFKGTLKALFDVRDGNNQEHLHGNVTAALYDKTITLNNVSISEIEKLNIPSAGTITIGNREYAYTKFKANTDSDGKIISYDFDLKDEITKAVSNESAEIGTSIKYKGIPYYMGQMNEFVRRFAKEFNKIHREGQDLDGNAGLDFFNIKDGIHNNITFNTVQDYHLLTVMNVTITDELYANPSKLALTKNIVDGVENKTQLDKLLALKSSVLFNEGDPASFLQTLVAEVGIDTRNAATFAKSQSNMLSMIDNQRLSISGVDIDEEAMNLVKFQNAYNLSAKVISTMNEIYNKLINDMGV